MYEALTNSPSHAPGIVRGRKLTEKCRDPWVDIIRVLAMLLIMIQHTPASHGFTVYATRAGVFFFFMAAGYFLARKYGGSPASVPWLNWRKAFLILCAYLFWIFVSMALFGFPADLVKWMTGLGIGRPPLGTVLWFLRDLMVFVLVSGALFRMPRACLLILSMASLVLFSTSNSLYLSFEYMDKVFCVIHPRGFGAFALGMFLCRYSLEELKNAVGKAWLYVLMVFPVIFIWEMYSTVQESALSLCMGVLWLASCAFLMMRYFPGISSFCARLAPSVFFVYAAHALVYECMLRLGFPRGSFWIWGMAVPLVFLALSGLYFLLARMCPAVLKYIALKN